MPKRNRRSQSAVGGWQKRRKRDTSSSPLNANRPRTYHSWADRDMLAAMQAVRSGQCGANKAARLHNIPPTTLKNRLSGRVKHGDKPGPTPYLTMGEEEELATFLISCSKIGYGKTRREVLGIVQQTLKKKGRSVENFNGDGWWTRFMERNPSLSLRCSDPLSRVRSNAVTSENMKNYFALLEKTLIEKDLLDKPHLIYNMDESGMPLDPKQLKRVAGKGMKKVHGQASGNKSQITIVACANAAGHCHPPMVIFKGERFNHEWSRDEVPNTLYGMSESGWIDSELFYYWLDKLFLLHIPPQRPVMLLCDGHGSHFTPEAIARAAEKGVVVFCIPPNTTHVAQPLDVSFFAPLKRYWSSICHTYLAENPGCVVTKLNFSLLFSRAWVKAINPETIINGFRKTGICPFNRSAIIIPESDTSSSSLEDDSNVQGDDNSSSLQVQGDDSSSSLEDDSTVKRDDNHILHGDNLRSSPELFSSFSDDKLALFQRRFESGYDLFIDQDYVTWLQENHPDNLPDELRVPGSGLGGGADLCDAGGGVRNGGWCDMSGTENPLDTSEDMVSVHDCNTSASDLSTLDEGPLTTSKNLPSEMVSESLAETRQVLSAVSAFLTLPSITSKKGKKPPGGARVLTSEQSLALLVDKEKKKREEEEAKEQRKRERSSNGKKKRRERVKSGRGRKVRGNRKQRSWRRDVNRDRRN